MISDALANLVKIRKLKVEPSSLREFDGLVRSALERATDAQNPSLTLASRFTLAYGASHTLHEADIAKVQEWLGHASIATTRIYDRRKMRPEDSPTFKIAY